MVRELLHTYWSKLASLIFRLSFPSTKSLFKNVHKLIRKTQFIKKKHENTKLVLFRVFLRCLPLLRTLNIFYLLNYICTIRILNKPGQSGTVGIKITFFNIAMEIINT